MCEWAGASVNSTKMVGIGEIRGGGAGRQTILFLHAHPDDEAIFTGGTIRRLADTGHRVVVVFATSGELGRRDPRDVDGSQLAAVRRDEARRLCAILGAQRVVFLDHVDSGTSDDPDHRPWGAFADVALDVVADHVAAIAEGERADAIVGYDPGGIYPHPDHLHVHRVAHRAARRAGTPTRYDVTVDREYLHFVDAHVAAAAGASLDRPRRIGLPTVEISATVDVRGELVAKHRAIAAHASQVGGDATFGSGGGFGDVYGWEWYVRSGPPGAIDRLAERLAPLRTRIGTVERGVVEPGVADDQQLASP